MWDPIGVADTVDDEYDSYIGAIYVLIRNGADDRKISEHDAEKLGCEQLWTVRNGIYAARGYCFKTARGREAFGNAQCRYDDQSQVPLNDYERANIRLIQAIEKRRGC